MTDPTQAQLDEARMTGFNNHLRQSSATEEMITDLGGVYEGLHSERSQKYDGLAQAIRDASDAD